MKANPYLIDDENPEWTKDDFAHAKRGYEFFTPEQLAAIEKAQLKMREQHAQKRVSLTLDVDILNRFKATGKGWQSRVNQALREATV
jgi:uncharacterized protein (DUF4415 family)